MFETKDNNPLRQCPAETRHKVYVLRDPYSVVRIASSYFPEWIIRNAFCIQRVWSPFAKSDLLRWPALIQQWVNVCVCCE